MKFGTQRRHKGRHAKGSVAETGPVQFGHLGLSFAHPYFAHLQAFHLHITGKLKWAVPFALMPPMKIERHGRPPDPKGTTHLLRLYTAELYLTLPRDLTRAHLVFPCGGGCLQRNLS